MTLPAGVSTSIAKGIAKLDEAEGAVPMLVGQVLGSEGEGGSCQSADHPHSRPKDVLISDSLPVGKQTAPQPSGADSPTTSPPLKNAKHSTEHFDMSTPVGSDADANKKPPASPGALQGQSPKPAPQCHGAGQGAGVRAMRCSEAEGGLV